jgi:hypothetical protein
MWYTWQVRHLWQSVLHKRGGTCGTKCDTSQTVTLLWCQKKRDWPTKILELSIIECIFWATNNVFIRALNDGLFFRFLNLLNLRFYQISFFQIPFYQISFDQIPDLLNLTFYHIIFYQIPFYQILDLLNLWFYQIPDWHIFLFWPDSFISESVPPPLPILLPPPLLLPTSVMRAWSVRPSITSLQPPPPPIKLGESSKAWIHAAAAAVAVPLWPSSLTPTYETKITCVFGVPDWLQTSAPMYSTSEERRKGESLILCRPYPTDEKSFNVSDWKCTSS